MKTVIRIAFNFYMVLKQCWIILSFQLLGYLALVEFEQGRDIIVSLSIGDASKRHAVFALVGVLWWSWQSWRGARAELHLSSFDFKQMSSRYALRAQVLVPRALGLAPLGLMVWSLYRSTGWDKPMIFVYLSFMVWMYVFFRFRFSINSWLKVKLGNRASHLPDYIHIKNEAYPASFLWAKQWRWLLFRVVWILLIFALILIYPISFTQYVGSAGLVLFALGAWQVMATFLAYAERHSQMPIVFGLILAFVGFSLINNNHGVRTLGPLPQRLQVDRHFDRWLQARGDSATVVLVAAQGGGLRSAYWTAAVLDRLRDSIPGFDRSIYAFSAVSGGSLGVATYTDPSWNGTSKLRRRLAKDFLSPVTGALILPEVIQRFLPVPIPAWDRARKLERAWERASREGGSVLMERGFVENYAKDERMLLFNATHAESGSGALISNVEVDPAVFQDRMDAMHVIGSDVRLSTAVGISSRFPFLTPPATVRDVQGGKANFVDGGYRDNYGGESMLQLYDHLRSYAADRGINLRFCLLFIENTLVEPEARIGALYELTTPLVTFNKVWSTSGRYTEHSVKLSHLPPEDRAVFIKLQRRSDQLIPLGWHLSEPALDLMDQQLGYQCQDAIEKLREMQP